MKFDGVSNNGDHDLTDAPEYTLIEYAYYKMAVAAGIVMTECSLLSENGRNHFMTTRFDRSGSQKLHMQTLGALAHIDYNVPGLCGYEEAAMYMREIGLTKRELEQFFRRMVFNVAAVNQDDHVKNTAFLMDREGKWTLSPAYDMTFSYDPGNLWLSAHQMTIRGKRRGITLDDLSAAGKSMGLSAGKMKVIAEEVHGAVQNWMEFASETGIREKTASTILRIMKENSPVKG